MGSSTAPANPGAGSHSGYIRQKRGRRRGRPTTRDQTNSAIERRQRAAKAKGRVGSAINGPLPRVPSSDANANAGPPP